MLANIVAQNTLE